MALTKETAQRILAATCHQVGLDPEEAELIRIGSNAVFRLRAQPVIVRISGDGGSALASSRLQVTVARWLEAERYPATRALQVDQPVVQLDHVATFWESVSEEEEYASIGQVASVIRRLHDLAAPDNLDLPVVDPIGKLERDSANLRNIQSGDADFLTEKIEQIRERYRRLSFDLQPGVIHGDANVGNVIVDRSGDPVLIDLDTFCFGPREWDLVQTALFYERFGWHTKDEYMEFVQVYGHDIMSWEGYPVLADYREVAMTLWLCGKAGHEKRSASEVAKRVESMRTGSPRSDWAPF